MSDTELAGRVTGALQSVDGVERLYRPGGVGGALRAVAGAVTDAVAGTATTLAPPTASVSLRGDTTVVVAALGAHRSRPARETLVAAADAVLAEVDAEGPATAEITVRVSRLH